jgi:hypothetical protein
MTSSVWGKGRRDAGRCAKYAPKFKITQADRVGIAFGPVLERSLHQGGAEKVLGQGLLERLGDHTVASGVRMDIRPERGRRAHPGPLADALDVERNATNEREVSG